MDERPIVVGIDGSPTAQAALHWASRAAQAWGRPLLVVLGGDVADPTELEIGSPNPSRALLDGAVAGLRRAGATCPIDTLLHDGQPEPLLDSLSVTAAAMVLGTDMNGRLASLIYGSVSDHVAAHARCPVITVPPTWIDRPPSPAPHLVVGVKPSPGGLEALEFAFSYAAATGIAVRAVRSWSRRDAVDPADPLTERDLQRALLDGLVDDALARNPGVTVTRSVTAGPPAAALRRAANGADLLVIGTRYPTGRTRSRLGPVASGLTHRMPCPVAVISAPGRVESSAEMDTTRLHADAG